jgi:hypothetical protein
MAGLGKQFSDYYTPKRLLVNAGIMAAASIFFFYQRPEHPPMYLGFASIAVIYFGFFAYRKLKSNS